MWNKSTDADGPSSLEDGGSLRAVATSSTSAVAEHLNSLEAEGDHLDQVSIVGFTNSRAECPFDEQRPGHEIWGCNNLWVFDDIDPGQFSRWFDVHQEQLLRGDPTQFDWLAAQDPERMVLYLEREYPGEIPASRRLPIEDIIPYYGPTYYTNTISYQLALAGVLLRPALERWKRWHRGPQEGEEPPQPKIGVYGVDMATNSEYGAQRPSCEFFIGILMGAGYQVEIASTSLLLSGAELYGLQDDGRFRHQLNQRRKDAQEEIGALVQQRAGLMQQVEQISARVHYLEGQMGEQTFWLERWTMPEVDREAASLPGQLDL